MIGGLGGARPTLALLLVRFLFLPPRLGLKLRTSLTKPIPQSNLPWFGPQTRTFMYKIIGADKKEYGPVDAETLRQWITQGRVNAQTLIRPETGGEWQPLSAFPELADIPSAPENPPTLSAPTSSTGVAPEVLGEDYDLDLGACISESWSAFTRNFGLVLGGSVVFLLIQGGMSAFAQIPFIGLLMVPVSFIVTGPLTGGFYYFLLRNIRRENVDIGDVFSGFKRSLGQLIGGYLVPVLLAGLAALPGALIMIFPLIQMSQQNNYSAAMVVMLAFGIIVAMIPAIYLGVCWKFTLPLIADKGLDFWTAMGVSRKRVSLHWWTVLGLSILMGLVNLAGALLCCVGLFASVPVSLGAMMVAYERMFNVRSATTPLAGPSA